jgi:hypothetical protein
MAMSGGSPLSSSRAIRAAPDRGYRAWPAHTAKRRRNTGLRTTSTITRSLEGVKNRIRVRCRSSPGGGESFLPR